MLKTIDKIILSSILIGSSLYANSNYKVAFVNKSSIDLYETPSNTSKKIQNYYKRSQKLNIYDCNNIGWCKTDNGYIKSYLVKIIQPIEMQSNVVSTKKVKEKIEPPIENINKIKLDTLITQNNIFKKELLRLQNENSSIKKSISKLKSTTLSQESFLDELDTNLDEIGRNTYANKVYFGLNTQFEVNQPNIKYTNGETRDNQSQIFRTRLRINMKSSINNYIKFYGRLSTYKNWGDSNEDLTLHASMDSKQGRTPDNTSTTYLERAYVDWRLNPTSDQPIYLTIGRQPSSNGPSYQIKDGTSRKGTYDALAFDGAADGIILTYINDNFNSYRIAYGVPNNGSSYNEEMKDTRVLALFYDKKYKSIKPKHLSQLYISVAKDMMAYPGLVDNNGNSLDQNIGDIYLAGFMFEVQNIDKFSYFLHYSMSRSKPNKNRVDLTQFNMTSTDGLMSSGDDYSDKIGYAFWIGTKYKYNTKYSYGLEYNQGSQNWFSFAISSDDPINKLQTRGKAIELYVINKINKQTSLTIGYIDIKYDYTNSGIWLGESEPIDDVSNSYQKESESNLYVKLNFKF